MKNYTIKLGKNNKAYVLVETDDMPKQVIRKFDLYDDAKKFVEVITEYEEYINSKESSC